MSRDLHYGVFLPDGTWARSTNKRVAIAAAKKRGGYVVAVNHGKNDAWDAPTFRHVGDVVADFRK
jgi:hypothetical protein